MNNIDLENKENLEKETTKENPENLENQENENNQENLDEDEDLDEDKLPFPNARVVRLMRESLDPHKQIKGVVKKEMNLWLGKMIERVCKKMNDFDYSYVDYGMFQQAIETFENIQTIELEKMRIIKALDKIKADCDVLSNDVERKFHE